MMMKGIRAAVFLSAAAMALWAVSGCYESTGITWYEAGVYKGKHDPLRDRLDNADLQRQLVERLRNVQTDR